MNNLNDDWYRASNLGISALALMLARYKLNATHREQVAEAMHALALVQEIRKPEIENTGPIERVDVE